MRRNHYPLVALFIFILISPGIVEANISDFHAEDPADTSLADFDIITYGAHIRGTNAEFWISVRGNINTHPEEGYLNGYVIHISDANGDVTIAAMWLNMSNKTHSYIYLTTSSGTHYLNKSDYLISGNRIDFFVNADIFKGINGVRVETIHARSNSPSSAASVDVARYGESTGEEFPSIMWVVIVIVVMVVIVILIILLSRGFIR